MFRAQEIINMHAPEKKECFEVQLEGKRATKRSFILLITGLVLFYLIMFIN